MYEYCTSDELYHYGRKGMKWGQHIYGKVKAARTTRKRKAALVKARATKAANKAAVEKRKQDLAKGKIPARKMTDAELNERIKHLELEKSYKKLLEETGHAKAEKGKSFVMRVLEKSGENIATQATTYAMGAAVNLIAKDVLGVKNATKTVKKKVGEEEVEEVVKYFEDIVNPRKGQKDK